MDDVRVLLRHRGNLVNMRTLRVPRGEEGGGGGEGSMAAGRGRRGQSLASLWGTVAPFIFLQHGGSIA